MNCSGKWKRIAFQRAERKSTCPDWTQTKDRPPNLVQGPLNQPAARKEESQPEELQDGVQPRRKFKRNSNRQVTKSVNMGEHHNLQN
jgi:hypothetical protein